MSSIKETWLDYTQNFFKYNAPITKQQYLRERWISALFVIPLFVWYSWFVINSHNEEYYHVTESVRQQFDINQSHQYSLIFFIAIITIYLLQYPLEMRLFNRRRKSSQQYEWLHVIFFITVFIYLIVCYTNHIFVELPYLLVGYILVSFTTYGNYYSKRDESE